MTEQIKIDGSLQNFNPMVKTSLC